MRLLGVLGGMSWASTAAYYRGLNVGVASRLGGLHSARLLVHSVDFAPVARAQHEEDWAATATLLGQAAAGLAAGGAQALLLATNTMHRVADAVQEAAGVPLLHIADPTAEALLAAGHRRVGLLATRFTMEQDFYLERLRSHGLEVLVPDEPDRELVHRVIYDELVHDVVREESRAAYVGVLGRLAAAGAEAVVLGCTEIGLLVHERDAPLPLVDTTALHIAAGVDWLCPG
ncbi:amino acid racemase [Phycicoccus endophyticus]|uniref:Amino acid racemase n=1 Tax=Phycicoccus endophyticus TaxID=1690220 RepID=A0A7G9R2L5_9MICO|nr:amino acid racemase [Phycicoccus endophyticus]NHI20697.1 amino acid racemase [Phycicoccus endophyticus]QNN49840.1 amino acid racemase [Phycicoccus endophyticus]GGL35633.1 aspartate racemase [Phycicoccus endophyticus]